MTSEEFLIKNDLGDFRLSNGEWLSDFMIEFAKYHVEAQANTIYEQGMHGLAKWDGDPFTGEGSYYLDKESILNAYPTNLIK